MARRLSALRLELANGAPLALGLANQVLVRTRRASKALVDCNTVSKAACGALDAAGLGQRQGVVLCARRCDAGVIEDALLVSARAARVAAERALAKGAGVCCTELSYTGLLHKVGQAFEAD